MEMKPEDEQLARQLAQHRVGTPLLRGPTQSTFHHLLEVGMPAGGFAKVWSGPVTSVCLDEASVAACPALNVNHKIVSHKQWQVGEKDHTLVAVFISKSTQGRVESIIRNMEKASRFPALLVCGTEANRIGEWAKSLLPQRKWLVATTNESHWGGAGARTIEVAFTCHDLSGWKGGRLFSESAVTPARASAYLLPLSEVPKGLWLTPTEGRYKPVKATRTNPSTGKVGPVGSFVFTGVCEGAFVKVKGGTGEVLTVIRQTADKALIHHGYRKMGRLDATKPDLEDKGTWVNVGDVEIISDPTMVFSAHDVIPGVRGGAKGPGGFGGCLILDERSNTAHAPVRRLGIEEVWAMRGGTKADYLRLRTAEETFGKSEAWKRSYICNSIHPGLAAGVLNALGVQRKEGAPAIADKQPVGGKNDDLTPSEPPAQSRKQTGTRGGASVEVTKVSRVDPQQPLALPLNVERMGYFQTNRPPLCTQERSIQKDMKRLEEPPPGLGVRTQHWGAPPASSWDNTRGGGGGKPKSKAKPKGRPRKPKPKVMVHPELKKPELSALRDQERKGLLGTNTTIGCPEWRAQRRRDLVLGANTAGSRGVAQAHWEQWRRFCGPGKVGPWLHDVDRGAGEDLVIDYVAFLFLILGYTSITVRNKVAAIGTEHVVAGHDNPLDEYRRLPRVLKTVKRQSPKVDRKIPVGPPLLREAIRISLLNTVRRTM